MMFIGFEI